MANERRNPSSHMGTGQPRVWQHWDGYWTVYRYGSFAAVQRVSCKDTQREWRQAR